MNKNGEQSLCRLLEQAVAAHGARAAVITNGDSASYEELGRRAQQAARLIGQQLTDNRRVVLLAENGLNYVILYWAVLSAGGVTVELNPGLSDAALRTQLQNAEPRLLLADADHAKLLENLGVQPYGTSILVADFEGGGRASETLALGLAEVWKGQDPDKAALEFPPPALDALASIVHTSGTTGGTKGVCLSHRNLAWTTEAIAKSFGLEREDSSERFAGNLPLFYTYGKSVLLLATYLAAPIVFSRRLLSPQNLLELVASSRVSHLSLVPYLCNLLVRSPRFTAKELTSLRRITVAGGAPSDEVRGEMLRRFPSRVTFMYGLTEMSTRVTCMPPGETDKRPGSCGRPIPGVHVKIVDEGGLSLRPFEMGEVLVRGQNRMQGYFRDPLATRNALKGDWLRTGDLGFLDPDGYLTITGRRKDVLKVMGESVSAWEVEAVIAGLPEVAEVAVKGVPHPVMGEGIGAFVVLREGSALGAEAIRLHCARTLGRSRVPTQVRFLDTLPRTASGKIQKHLLALD